MSSPGENIRLICPAYEYAGQILEYRNEFSEDRERVTYVPGRIPGMDHLEEFQNVNDWLDFCQQQEGRISWYMSVRKSDGRLIGFCSLKHRLEYDDDDAEFASNIGYSVRPSERGKGYGTEQLRLVLEEARKAGLGQVRVVCISTNERSRRVILRSGGVFAGSVHGDESGLTVERYDIGLL
ncbi:MAG: GNAT family N-acetyltransferase [Oscillospiraceae bacterium]|nr:GNAT family N-acetyltransferase [Oscillospiraceae bacterium]